MPSLTENIKQLYTQLRATESQPITNFLLAVKNKMVSCTRIILQVGSLRGLWTHLHLKLLIKGVSMSFGG